MLARLMHAIREIFVFRYEGKPPERMGRKATCLGSQDDGRGAAEGTLVLSQDRWQAYGDALPPQIFLPAHFSIALNPARAQSLDWRYTKQPSMLKLGNSMRRFQVVAEIGQMYADPYVRAVTRPQLRAIGLTWLNLFTTVIAFIACALPVLIAILWPATAAAALMKAPLFLAAVAYRNWIFGISGLLLVLAGVAVWRARCPHALDLEITHQCRRIRLLNRLVLRASAGLWLAGILGTYIVMPARMALGW